eukprot:scaffold152884_cov29-Tisochrysis_lutea.AAC.1
MTRGCSLEECPGIRAIPRPCRVVGAAGWSRTSRAARHGRRALGSRATTQRIDTEDDLTPDSPAERHELIPSVE